MSVPRITSPKRAFFRLLLVGLIVLVTVALIEVVLQVTAFFVGPRALVVSGTGREEIVLCLGDSNTYGVFYSQEQTYPAQLQTILDRRAPGSYRVLNLGLPGMNSSQVAALIAGWIDRFRPRAIVVSVGINNYWNRADTSGREQSGRSFLDRIRLLRLIRFLMAETTELPTGTGRPAIERRLLEEGAAGVEHRAAETGEVLIAHEGDISSWNRSHAEVSTELCADLVTMAELAGRNDVDLFVMTYAAFPLPERKVQFLKQQNVNDTMRRCSRDHDLALVDLRDRFLDLLPPEQPRSLLFASESESHANPVGYREVATLAANAIHPGRTVVFPFLDHLQEAVIEREQVPFEQIAHYRIRVERDERWAMFQHPTSSISFSNVSISGRTHLAFAIAVRPEAWGKPGDGVLFAIDVLDQHGRRHERFSRYLDPKHVPAERRWIEQRVDLSDLAGQRVTIVFRTLPGPAGNRHFDWSAWGEPRLVSEVPEEAS
jgi:hypothetical protein